MKNMMQVFVVFIMCGSIPASLEAQDFKLIGITEKMNAKLAQSCQLKIKAQEIEEENEVTGEGFFNKKLKRLTIMDVIEKRVKETQSNVVEILEAHTSKTFLGAPKPDSGYLKVNFWACPNGLPQ